MAKASDRRGAPRMSLDAAAIIRFDSVGSDIRSRIVNASENGILLAMPAPRPVGTRMHVTVRIGDPVLALTVSGIIVHGAENRNAPPGFTTRVGGFVTNVGTDWVALCRRISDGG